MKHNAIISILQLLMMNNAKYSINSRFMHLNQINIPTQNHY
jgi:hypothetical protein